MPHLRPQSRQPKGLSASAARSNSSPTRLAAHFTRRPPAIQSGVRGHPPFVVRSAPRRQRRGNLRTVLAAWANLPARLLAATSRQSRSCARPSVCAAPLRIVASLLIFGASSTPFSGFAQFSHHSARSSGRLAANAASRPALGWARADLVVCSMVVFLSSEGGVVG